METTVKCINHEVVASIYKRCYGKLLAYLAGCTHDTMDAEDMAQDIFVKMLSIGVVTEATAEALLFVMARRMVIDDARHKAFVRQGMKQLACTVSQYDTHSVARRLEVDELLERDAPYWPAWRPSAPVCTRCTGTRNCRPRRLRRAST